MHAQVSKSRKRHYGINGNMVSASLKWDAHAERRVFPGGGSLERGPGRQRPFQGFIGPVGPDLLRPAPISLSIP